MSKERHKFQDLLESLLPLWEKRPVSDDDNERDPLLPAAAIRRVVSGRRVPTLDFLDWIERDLARFGTESKSLKNWGIEYIEQRRESKTHQLKKPRERAAISEAVARGQIYRYSNAPFIWREFGALLRQLRESKGEDVSDVPGINPGSLMSIETGKSGAFSGDLLQHLLTHHRLDLTKMPNHVTDKIATGNRSGEAWRVRDNFSVRREKGFKRE